MTTAILIKTHIIDDRLLSMIEEIEQAIHPLLPDHQLILSLDALQAEPAPDCLAGTSIRTHLINRSTLERSGLYIATEVERTMNGFLAHELWFHTDYPILLFAADNPQYEYVWGIEYDVRYSGDWVDFFKAFVNDTSDFIASHFTPESKTHRWNMWQRPSNLPVASPERMRCFFPVSRFSRHACNILFEAYSSGYFGYCEVSAPTLLHHHSCTMRDILSSTDFAPLETFRFQPVWVETEVPRSGDKLYHPVRRA